MSVLPIIYRLQSLSADDTQGFEKRSLEISGGTAIKGQLSANEYNAQNRIMRAKTFLEIARTTSLLPMKISYFIAVLECLFTTDNVEVSYKVRERATFYIGGDNEARIKNFDLIGVAYGVRSDYLHGQQLSKKVSKLETLAEISQGIDELLRIILNKVLFTDTEIFLQDNTALSAYFKNQLSNLS